MKLQDWANAMHESADLVERFMSALEMVLVAIIGRMATWIAPLPSAILTGRAATRIFELSGVWLWVLVGTIELVGLVTSNLWLTAKDWNENKRRRQRDPVANEQLALALMGAYFATTFLLLLAIEVPRVAETGNPVGLTALLFPVLSIVSLIALNERTVQSRRQTKLDQEEAQRRVRKKTSPMHKLSTQNSALDGQNSDIQSLQTAAQQSTQHAVLGAVNMSRRERKAALKSALLNIYRDNPNLGATEAGRLIGVHRNTIYTYTDELAAAGKIRRTSQGIEVVQ